jgi:CBS domain-containing protein
VLTDRDLKRALDPDLGLPPKDELFVRDVCVPDAYAVDTGEPLDRVLEEMTSRHLGSVLITSHGRLAGIFTSTDACRVLRDHLRALAPPRPGDNAA